MKKLLLVFMFPMILGSCSFLVEYEWFLRGKSEEGRRKTFEETKTYNESKEQDLLRYRLEYMQAPEDERDAIAFTIRHMFADYDENKLSPELRDFLKEIKYGE